MRTVGHRQPLHISFATSATSLAQGARDKNIADRVVLERAPAALNAPPEKP